MNAREAILSRLQSPPGRSIAQEAATLLIANERPHVDASALESEMLARLAQPSLAASVDQIDGPADVPDAVRRYLTGQGLEAALYCPPDPRLSAMDWTGFALDAQVAADQPAALAIARCGVAETGSLIFETAPDAPMLPNFLALHHIVLLPADAITAHLEDAILPAGPQPRAHYWVTGVSGTTDIEGTYVRGAHGPRFLHVVLMRRGWGD